MATASHPSPNKEALSKLDGILNCPICLDSYTDPRALPCLHTYCKKCIDNLSTSGKKGARAVKCPECRRVCQLGEEGAERLPKAFHVHNLLEIKESLKFSSTSEPLAQPHDHPDTRPHPDCSKHKKIKNLYCKKCHVLICLICSHESHSSHLSDIDEADTFFRKHVREIKSSLEPVNTKIDEATRMLACFDVTERQIREKGEVVKREIDQAIEQHVSRLQELIVTLRKSKESLLRDADTATHQKLKLHSLERAELERVLKQLMSCKELVEEELKLRSNYQIKTGIKKLTQRISEAHSEIKVSELQPRQNADTEYVRNVFTISPPDVGSVRSTLNYRSIQSLSSVNIPQCVLHGMTTEVSLITSLPLSVKMVQCKLNNIAHSADESAISCSVKLTEKGQFKILLNPNQPGMHTLSVCVNDTHIHGSPFNVMVMSIGEWRGQKLKVFTRGLRHPHGLAVTDDGRHVIIAERQGHCVAVLSTDTGEMLYRFGKHGTGPGEFVSPFEVEVSGDNHIFVKDKHGIQKFTLNGFHEAMPMALVVNNGMAVLPTGNVLTCAHNSVIQLPLGLSSKTFAGKPNDIAVDTEGRIYVLTVNHGIHLLTSKGKYVSTFGKEFLNQPYQFCIDSNNIIYVTDGSKVTMATTDGKFLGSFGNHPILRGISVSKTTGDLYISKASGEVFVSRNA